MLVISGTHGVSVTGQSGLTNRDLLDHRFYAEDCLSVGVHAGSWDGLPPINQPAVKIEPPPPGSFYDDEDLKEMDFRVANMSYYYGHENKLIDDINEVNFERSF